MSSVDSKRIAKNTLFLYIRMLLLLAVSLYTSRVILKVLGIDDYGIYNLIAGFVTFFAFINNAIVSAMQRFFNVALGNNDAQNYREVFSMSINILVGFSILVLLLGETLGLWFVMNKLNIPEGRYEAAMWVYHISLITFLVNTLRTPYHASIIAHERMSFYAYVSLFEVFVRLGVVILLMILPGDHLILYALLYLLVVFVVNIIYVAYCKIKFTECKYEFKRDKSLFRELLGFSGWTLMGQASVVIKNQGEAIFINRFFSVAANAAMGVAAQVANALELFVSNFQTAFTPQLIQSYASKEYDAHIKLLFRSSKFSYYLLLILMVPTVSNIDYILNLWLEEVPKYTDLFVIFILISYLFNALSTPFTSSINATGNIKIYQISHSATFLCGLCAIFYILKCGSAPYSVSIVAVFIQFVSLIIRLYYSHKYLHISYMRFIKEVIAPIIPVTVLSILFPCFIRFSGSDILHPIFSIIIEVIITAMLILFVGMNGNERHLIFNAITKSK